MSTPKVEYGYADGSANTVRPTSLTYPSGRVLTYSYGTSDGIDDSSSRIASLVDDDMAETHLADYAYLGRRSFVEVDYAQPEVKWTLIGTAGGNDPDTGDIYRGLDRFGRVKDNDWYDYGSSIDADRIKYGYDRNGIRTYRENVVATAQNKNFDELYLNDLINRLAQMDRGRLNGNKDDVTNLEFAQCWSLDETGNWKDFRQDDDGSGWDLIQQRTANEVNEITGISETTGPSWATPAYDPAGNMTTMPKPADPTGTYAATFDAWNRLTKLADGANTVAEYEYDGAKRRTIKKNYTSGVLDEARHLYYTEPSKWQVIEERVNSDTDPNRQFVCGLRYIDDFVLRDRDTTGDGTLDERLYALQDANWKVTSLTDTSGTVQERYAYSAYGMPLFFDSSWTSRSGSSYASDILYAGYQHDPLSDLYCVRIRYLHSSLGTWMQRDPFEYLDTMSLYQYVLSDPLNGHDPFGLAEHTKNRQPKNKQKHTNPRSGRGTTNNRGKKGWKQRTDRPKKRKGRKGSCSPGLIGRILIFECEAYCALVYDECLDNANEQLEFRLEGAYSQEVIDIEMEIYYYDVAECAINYGICAFCICLAA